MSWISCSSMGGILRQLLPPHCWKCQQWLSGDESHSEGYPFLCSSCFVALPWSDPVYSCSHCGNPTSEPNLPVCPLCVNETFAFDRLWSGFHYDEPIKKWLLQFKFGKQEHLAKLLGKLLAVSLSHAPQTPEFDVIIPIPLHRKRLFQRGFNQALLVAHHTFKGSAVIQPRWLTRTRATLPQTELSVEDRGENVAGAFCAAPQVRGKRVLLVDDVVTTGATLNAAAQVLKTKGAVSVDILVLARRVLDSFTLI